MIAWPRTGFNVFNDLTTLNSFICASDLPNLKEWLSQCSSEDPNFNTYVAHVLREADDKSWGAIENKARDPEYVQSNTQMYVQPTLNPYLVYAYH